MKKVSFDFDGTLDRDAVQELARKLIDQGIEVWICTSRLPDKEAPSDNWNKDLFFIAAKLGIPEDRVIFTSGTDKYKFLEDGNFVWHLDDDLEEIRLINSNIKTKGIPCFGNFTWEKDAWRLLSEGAC